MVWQQKNFINKKLLVLLAASLPAGYSAWTQMKGLDIVLCWMLLMQPGLELNPIRLWHLTIEHPTPTLAKHKKNYYFLKCNELEVIVSTTDKT